MGFSRISCRRCGIKLDGAPGDVAFACPECRKAFAFHLPRHGFGPPGEEVPDLESRVNRIRTFFNGAADYPVECIPLPGDPALAGVGRDLLLPFWLFGVRPAFSCESDKRAGRFHSLSVDLYPMVPAYAFHGLQYVGWPGSERDLPARPATTAPRVPVYGIARDPLTAFILAWFFIYRRADNLSDVSNVEMDLDHFETTLVGVEVEERDGKLRLPFSDRTYPACYFDDLDAVRKLLG